MATVKPQIPVSSVKVAVNGLFGPATWANVFYLDVTAGSHTPGQVISAVASAIHDLYAVVFTHGSFPAAWSVTTQTITYRDADDSIVRVRVADAQAGTAAGDYQDAQVAYLINWSTGDPRRGGKPRQYVPGVPNSIMQDSAHLDPTAAAGFDTRVLTWLTSLPGLSIPMQLVEMSFRNGGSFRDAAHSYPIIGGTLNPVVATQRRRVDRLRPS